VPERTAEQVQGEIEQARDALAAAVDQLAVRTSPKRLVSDTKQSLRAQAQTPAGKAVIGGAAALVLVLVVLRFRKHGDGS
jgi:hypothetical protein